MKKVIRVKKIIDYLFKRKNKSEKLLIKEANMLIEQHNSQVDKKVCVGFFEYKIKPVMGKTELDTWLTVQQKVYNEIEDTDFAKVFKSKFVHGQNYLLSSYKIFISPSKYYDALNLIYFITLIYMNRFNLIEE